MRAVIVSMVALFATGCGGSEKATEDRPTTIRAGAGSLAARVATRPGENVQLALGAADFAVGENRIPFAVIRPSGELVQAPRARLFLARGLGKPAEIKATAELVPLGPHSHPGVTKPHDHADITDLYVARVRVERPGRYALLAEPEGETIQALGEIDVKRTTASPAIGSKAIPSANPTLADAPAAKITTSRPPDTELLRVSVKDALAARDPFVLVFATPQFCRSRTCGPTVEVVDKVQKAFAGSEIRFIHVEVYENNDPANGVNRWMREWKLPSEPWVFVVDGQGIIRAKFEGSVSLRELEQALRQHLAA